MSAQTAILIVLCYYYNGSYVGALSFLSLYSMLIFVLVGGITRVDTLTQLQVAVLPIMILSKVSNVVATPAFQTLTYNTRLSIDTKCNAATFTLFRIYASDIVAFADSHQVYQIGIFCSYMGRCFRMDFCDEVYIYIYIYI